jgi:hypothetical protein
VKDGALAAGRFHRSPEPTSVGAERGADLWQRLLRQLVSAGLILTHLLAFLVGRLVGERLDWNAVRRDPAGYRMMLAALVLLAMAAAAILLTRGVAS